MSEPTVCCIMLTADRPALAERAVACFRKQTYAAKSLLIYDTGEDYAGPFDGDPDIWHRLGAPGRTIGDLRNVANTASCIVKPPDVLIHWDDDDWSHPARIAEQVALMQESGAEVVGYNEMLFWREPVQICSDRSHDLSGEAWIYKGSMLGTSLCYRRELWQRFPFPSTSYGEDTDWLKQLQHGKVKIEAPTSIPQTWEVASRLAFPEGPRMIARIHAGNTSKAYSPEAMRSAPHHWRRTPEWDGYCRSVIE